MPGMATQAQLKKLRAADGKAFDHLFLTLMTPITRARSPWPRT